MNNDKNKEINKEQRNKKKNWFKHKLFAPYLLCFLLLFISIFCCSCTNKGEIENVGLKPNLPLNKIINIKHILNPDGYFEVLEGAYGQEAVPLNEKEIFFATRLVNEGKKNEYSLPAQIYNIKDKKFRSLNTYVNIPRESYNSINLDDGRILIFGGYTNLKIQKFAEIYNINENKFVKINDTNFVHNSIFMNYVKLLDGRILIITGDKAEIFNPQTNKFTIAGKKILYHQKSVYDVKGEKIEVRTTNNIYRGRTAIALLNDGRVLLLGPNYDLNPNNAEIYDPKTNSFEIVGSQNFPMFNRDAVTLQDGRVLVTGGTKQFYSESVIPEVKENGAVWSADNERQDNNAEIFDPYTKKFTAINPLKITRQLHRSILLSNGKVLIVNGTNNKFLRTKDAKQAELFDPQTCSFAKISSTNNGSYVLRVFPLNKNEILIVSASGWELFKY